MWLNPASGILAGEDMPIYKISSDPDNKSMIDIQTDQNVRYNFKMIFKSLIQKIDKINFCFS